MEIVTTTDTDIEKLLYAAAKHVALVIDSRLNEEYIDLIAKYCNRCSDAAMLNMSSLVTMKQDSTQFDYMQSLITEEMRGR